VRTVRAWLWLARQSAPAFDRASAERDRLRAARDAVRLALPGRARTVRRARAGVLRELNGGRLAPAAAVAASGLMDRPGVPALHRAALAAALGGTAAEAHDTPGTGTEIDAVRDALRTEIASVRDYAHRVAQIAGRDIEQARGSFRTEIASARAALRTEIAAVRAPAPDARTGGPGRAGGRAGRPDPRCH
jgi:hypothetical protein